MIATTAMTTIAIATEPPFTALMLPLSLSLRAITDSAECVHIRWTFSASSKRGAADPNRLRASHRGLNIIGAVARMAGRAQR